MTKAFLILSMMMACAAGQDVDQSDAQTATSGQELQCYPCDPDNPGGGDVPTGGGAGGGGNCQPNLGCAATRCDHTLGAAANVLCVGACGGSLSYCGNLDECVYKIVPGENGCR